MPFQLEIFHFAIDFPIAQWQALIPKHKLLHNLEYLQSLEKNQNGHTTFRYVFVKQNEKVIGVAYFQIVQFKGSQLSNYRASNFLYRIFQRMALPFLKVKMLASGNLLMTGENGFFFLPETSDETIAEAYLQVVNTLLENDKDTQAFLMSNVFGAQAILKQKFLNRSFYSIDEEPDMQMVLRKEWKHFSDYLQSLSSKYRVRAKRCLVQSKVLEKRELSLEEIQHFGKQIFELYQETIAHASFSLVELQEDFFVKQKKIFKERYVLFAYFLNGNLVGFNSLYCNENSGDVHYVGLNYEVNKTHAVYQRMLYDMIECGIGKGFTHLHFGRTATEIKSSVGATPVWVSGLIKFKNPLINYWIAQPLSAAIKPKDFVLRNPFK